MSDGSEFRSLLIERRRARRLTQRQLGQRMSAESRYLPRSIPPVAKSTISSYEQGYRRPQHVYAWLLCRALDCTPDDLKLGDLLTPERVTEITSGLHPQEVVPSRLTPGIPAGMADALRTLPLDWERIAAFLFVTRRLDRGALTDLRQMTTTYGSQRTILTPRAMLPPALAHLLVLRNQLLVAETHAVRHELATMAGEMAVVAGELWHTMLNYEEAARLFRFALSLADEFGEGAIRASALLGWAALYRSRLHPEEGIPGEPGAAVHMIDAAEASIGPMAPPRLRLRLHSARAWQHAAIGHGREARRDLEAAAAALAEPLGAAEGLLTPWDRGYHLVCRALVSRLFGRSREAVESHGEMLRHLDEVGADDLRRVHFVVLMCMACVEARQMDRAEALLAETVQTVLASGVVMLLRRMKAVLHAAPALGNRPGITDLKEQLDELVVG